MSKPINTVSASGQLIVHQSAYYPDEVKVQGEAGIKDIEDMLEDLFPDYRELQPMTGRQVRITIERIEG